MSDEELSWSEAIDEVFDTCRDVLCQHYARLPQEVRQNTSISKFARAALPDWSDFAGEPRERAVKQ